MGRAPFEPARADRPFPTSCIITAWCGGRKGEGTWTPMGCEAAQSCEAKEVLHGTAVPSASRLWNGPCPSRPFFQQQQRGGMIASLRDVHCYPGLQGWLIQNLCMGASARGDKETNFNVLGIIR